MLDVLLKQPVVALREQPEEVAQAYEEQKILISLRKRGHTDIVKMVQPVTSEKRTPTCIDALDECILGHRIRFFDPPNQILQKAERGHHSDVMNDSLETEILKKIL